MSTLRGGRSFRVTGANSQTGEDVEIMVEAYDEADAARAANRQGVFVSRCVAAGADGSTWAGSAPSPVTPTPPAAAATATFAESLAGDAVVQRLVRAHPQLGDRVKRMNEDDRACLSDLVGEQMGISYRDSAHVGKLMNDAEKWK